MESLAVLLGDHQAFHSTLQCRKFITEKTGVTPYGMYRQALRELDSRVWSILDELLRREELRLEIEEKESDAEQSYRRGHSDAYKTSLEAARQRLQIAQLERHLSDRYREWGEFYAQACVLREQLGLLPGQSLGQAERDRLDLQMFSQQFARKIRARILAGEQALDGGLVEILLSMPPEIHTPLLAAGQDPDAFLEWAAVHASPPRLPEPSDLPSIDEVKALIQEKMGTLAIGPERERLALLLDE